MFTEPAGFVYTNESRWAAGLRAWNARYTAQGLDLEDCNIARDAKLKAIVGYGQAGGCFARLPPLSEQDPRAEFWWHRAGCDYFHAIYHDAPRHRAPPIPVHPVDPTAHAFPFAATIIRFRY